MTTLAELRNGGPTAAWKAKQLHPVPDAPVVQREPFILERCRGKVVLDIGASGPMHEAIVEVAKYTYGLEKPNSGLAMVGGSVLESQVGTFTNDKQTIEFVDLDDYHQPVPFRPDVDIVVAGETLEHLSNPGWLLKRLRQTYAPPVQLLVTVPNAFYGGQRRYLDEGTECCNRDHTSWHSPRTIQTLLEREGYAIKEFRWYGREGQRPKFSEGLIVVAE